MKVVMFWERRVWRVRFGEGVFRGLEGGYRVRYGFVSNRRTE